MPSDQVRAVRAFNRFYTHRLGLLEEGLLDSRFTLTEARVLYELAQRGATTAGEVGGFLGLDAGYLSRILRKFEADGLLERQRSDIDARSATLTLTERGRAAFAPLDRASAAQVAAMLEALPAAGRGRLVESMATVRQLLGGEGGSAVVRLRDHRPGDIGWAVERHGALYADEFGWDASFEGLVAEILGGFLRHHDPARERAWIAEVDGARAGCVFLVRNAEDAAAAQLRCLLVEPWARGLGLGRRLVESCIGFAREAGYRRMLLWTNDVLVSARRIYQAAGFELIAEEPHRSFGHDLVGQTWQLEL